MIRIRPVLLILIILGHFSIGAQAATYSGYHPTIRGGLRTAGMAGAVTAIPYPVIAHNENPAGLAMTTGSIQLHAASSLITDEYLHAPQSRPFLTGSFGFGIPVYPHGFGIGRWNTQIEYDPVTDTEIFAREYRASAAKLFLTDRLSLGASMVVGEAGHTQRGYYEDTWTPGFGLGALYQFPGRHLLGLSYTHELNYQFSRFNFYSPARIQAGYAWVPNSVFEIGFTLQALAPQPGTYLLANPTVRVGENWTVQPRLGLRYLLFELKNLRIQLYSGTYFEPSRFAGYADRMHVTSGMMIEAWVFDIGLGRDWAPHYSNKVASLGFDVIKIARILKLIPIDPVPGYRGLLPHPFRKSDAFLPYPLQEERAASDEQPDIVQITADLPKNVQSGFSSPVTPIQNIKDDLTETVETWTKAVPEEMRRLSPSPVPIPKKGRYIGY